MAVHVHELALFADYFQFHLRDDAATGDLSLAWTAEAVERMCATAPGVIGLGTARNMTVRVRLEVLEGAPGDGPGDSDHVVEGPLQVGSGRVTIAGCTDHLPDALQLALAPGSYRVRLSAGGLGTLSDDGLDGEDHYRVQLWPAPLADVCVLLQWRG